LRDSKAERVPSAAWRTPNCMPIWGVWRPTPAQA